MRPRVLLFCAGAFALLGCSDAGNAPQASRVEPARESLVRHAYSECNADGFWHVVEDVYRNGVKSRVFDQKTGQKCSDPRPSPIGVRYKSTQDKDPPCGVTQPAGEIIIPECRGVEWVNVKYRLVKCDRDGSTRIETPELTSTPTGVRCAAADTGPPPAPPP